MKKKQKQIVLISCVKKKLNKKTKAEYLYTSDLFKSNLRYAKSLKPDTIYILSAKYGLLKLSDIIEPYDKTLNKMKKAERVEWAKEIITSLKEDNNIENDNFIFLAGKKYREFLLEDIVNSEIPMEGLPLGKQLQWLKEKLKNG